MMNSSKHESDSSPVSKPSEPKCRRSINSKDMKKSYSPNNNFQSLHMEGKESRKQNTSKLSENEDLSKDESTSYDTQITESSSEEDEEPQFSLSYSKNRSKTISPERKFPIDEDGFVPESACYKKPIKNTKSSEITQNEQQARSKSYFFFFLLIIISIIFAFSNKINVQTQSINEPPSLSLEIEKIKTTFHNQESDIWNDISSAINEVISRTPKTPSIILLFANETTTMDCLAAKLAHTSSIILHADNYLDFNPENFGNDVGEVITTLKNYPPEKKKVVMIRDILNINTEAIKALHNLCDRINPLVAEVLYILTMQTNHYQSSQKKLDFVEKQIYNNLSKNVDRDVLMALVTRITDGAIIPVQAEPRLRYC